MADFTNIATSVIADAKISGDINASLSKIASLHELNNHETQRVVEEVNIGLFLDKMQQGTQHEDYELASPVEIDASSSSGGSSSLEKEASVGLASKHNAFFASPDMYDISIHSDPLMKAASFISVEDVVSESDLDWIGHSDKDRLKKEAQDSFVYNELKKESSAKISTTIDSFEADLAYSIKGDVDLVKTALALAHEDDSDFVYTLLSDTHFKSEEILAGDISETSISNLNKIASEKWDKSLSKIAGIQETFNDTKTVLAYPFKNPRTSVAILGAGYVAKKALAQEKELKERQRMMQFDTENENAKR